MLCSSRIWIGFAVTLALPALVACSGVASPASGTPSEAVTAVPTEDATVLTPTEEPAAAAEEPATGEAASAEVALPTNTPAPELAAESVDWTATVTIDGDYYVRGNPGAPIRLVDYSDFL